VAYTLNLVPHKWLVLYGINPMASVVGGFRYALVGTHAPPFEMIAVSGAVAAVVLVTGLFKFQRVERGFADII
jgi:lipopolysaccharide transport system permease protein